MTTKDEMFSEEYQNDSETDTSLGDRPVASVPEGQDMLENVERYGIGKPRRVIVRAIVTR